MRHYAYLKYHQSYNNNNDINNSTLSSEFQIEPELADINEKLIVGEPENNEKDIEVSLEGLNIAPSNLVQLDNDITNGEDSDDSDDDDGELVVEDVTNEQES